VSNFTEIFLKLRIFLFSIAMSAARALAQALSNTVTSNELLVDKLWDLYLDLPEDEAVLMCVLYFPPRCMYRVFVCSRLLGSHDPKTLLITLIFILNCTHESTKRLYVIFVHNICQFRLDRAVRQLMVKSKVGIRMSVALLDKMVVLHEAEEGSEGAKAFDVG
jgi:ataxin-10